MTFNRFENILNALTFSDATQSQDPWALIRGIVNGFNETRRNVVHPGEILVVDECMSAWKCRESKYTVEGIPHKTKIIRKPEGKGAELKSIADGETGLGLELVEGKHIQQTKQYSVEFGEGTAVVLRFAQNYQSSGRTIVADSAFASVKTLNELEKKMGLFFTGIVKTASKEFPKEHLKKWYEEGQPRGEHVVYSSKTYKGNAMYAMCWADKKPIRNSLYTVHYCTVYRLFRIFLDCFHFMNKSFTECLNCREA
jgi:hypothetical protein